MSWPGIPYPFSYSESISSLIIQKLPEVTLNTPFAWETIISSFVAGAIPAWIAWVAIKNNYRLAKLQANLADKRELVDKLRVTALDYTLAINKIGQLTEEFLKGPEFQEFINGGPYPQKLQDALDNAQKLERYLLLLIRPDAKGAELLESIIVLNNAVQPYVTLISIDPEVPQKIRVAIDEFMLKFHGYID